jgi:hypothetical protein
MRQMREYKREKNTIEAELRTIEERSRHHDDHLRTIELWFDQVSNPSLRGPLSMLIGIAVGRRDQDPERRKYVGSFTRW